MTYTKLESLTQAEFEREIIEGCREMAEVYLEIQREFEPLDTEVTRALLASELRASKSGLG